MKEYILKTAQNGFAAGKVFDLEAADEKRPYAGTAERGMPAAGGTAESGTPAAGGTAESGTPAAGGTAEKGTPAAGGTAAEDPEKELRRFDEAVLALKQELTDAAEKADGKTAAIFEAEQMLLEDDRYAGAIRRLIRGEGQDALSAVRQTGHDLAAELAASGNSYIRSRSDDVKGISRRLEELLGGAENRSLTVPSILVAKELSPLQLSGLDASLLLGIITVRGTPSSHVSVIAGNLGIPYVYGVPEAEEAARTCSRLIIDGEKLILDPEEELYQQALRRMEESRRHREDPETDCADRLAEDSAADGGGRSTEVFANIAGPEDLEALLASGAEGVGLLRSEFLFLGRDSAPSEEEQFEAYRSIVEEMGERATVIRTMDLGSDKRPAWLQLPEEKNPALGWRGLRISLKERELFKTQLRALLRVSVNGNVKVMVPMVTSVREIEAVRACMKECADELTGEGVPFRMPPLGAMVETPAAALIAEQLARKVDFFSIGTNDLTQYTLALDREAEGLEDYDDPGHEAVLSLIRMTVQAGAVNNIPTSVCGELAGNPAVIKSLIEAGVNKLSVSVPRVRATMRIAAEAEKALKKEMKLESEPGWLRQTRSQTFKKVEIAAPVDGTLIPRDEIPDPAFAFGTMWQCAGIMPENGTVYAPCDGVVSGIAATKHAMTFTATDGREILVHVGIDTVGLNGRGFTVLVQEGAAVSKGDIVMEADLDVIREAGLSPVVIIACAE